MKPTHPTRQVSMPENEHTENKKGKAKEGRKAELEARRLKIKKELDEIIEKTEGQNRALGKIMKKSINSISKKELLTKV